MKLVQTNRKNYRGALCIECFKPITIGSKSGFCKQCQPKHQMSESAKEKIRQSKLGNKNPMYGRKTSLEVRRKISSAQKGKKNHFWKGGITSRNKMIRKSLDYKLWRESVFQRDNYKCVIGGKKHGNKLNADHIKPFADFPELRFAIDNGRTLCVDCHRKTETFGRPKKI